MIVVLKHGAEPDKREAALIGWLKNQGLGVHVSGGRVSDRAGTDRRYGAR